MRDLMRDAPDRNEPSLARAGVPVAPRWVGQELPFPRFLSYVGQPFAPI